MGLSKVYSKLTKHPTYYNFTNPQLLTDLTVESVFKAHKAKKITFTVFPHINSFLAQDTLQVHS